MVLYFGKSDFQKGVIERAFRCLGFDIHCNFLRCNRKRAFGSNNIVVGAIECCIHVPLRLFTVQLL